MIPDWLLPTFALFPALMLYTLGVGLPWSDFILPRHGHYRRLIVFTAACALGPALSSAALFFVGTFGTFTRESVLFAVGSVATIGWIAAVLRRRFDQSESASLPAPEKLHPIDVLLVVLIGLVVLIRVWNTAYWPFTTYDELWVYGHNGQLFTLTGSIPRTVGYYPQNVPLAYTYFQVLWGSVDPHAARVIVPWFGFASILAAILLGMRMLGLRLRTGLLAGAIWALYPQHGAWSQFGDLEVPTALYFTLAITFYLYTVRVNPPGHDRRYAVMSGLMLGAALWTKPTSGALIWGGLLIAGVTLFGLVRRGDLSIRSMIGNRTIRNVAVIFAVGAPLGGLWYLRNIALGLPPLVLPGGYWQDAAQRSGAELGWLLLILGALTVLKLITPHRPTPSPTEEGRGVARSARIKVPPSLRGRDLGWGAVLSLVLFTACMLPSALNRTWPDLTTWSSMLIGREPPFTPSRFGVEVIGVVIGAAVIIGVSRRERSLTGVQLTLLWIIPYLITWFWSYSYHYRLSFPVVPALIAILASQLDYIGISLGRIRVERPLLNAAGMVLVIVLALPGLVGTATALPTALYGTLPDDDSKLANGNPALMNLVYFLRTERANADRPLVIVAPNELRLNYFFPLDDIRGDTYPTTLEELRGVDLFIDSSPGQRLYLYKGIQFNQVLRSLTRGEVMRRIFTTDDGNFRFSVYKPDLDTRFKPITVSGVFGSQFGSFAVLEDIAVSRLDPARGSTFFITNYWRVQRTPQVNYSVFIHLWDVERGRLAGNWGGEPVTGAFSIWQNVQGEQLSIAYSTTLWQQGELVVDEWKFNMPTDIEPGRYELRVGLFDSITGERVTLRLPDGTMRDYQRVNDLDVK